jgi:antitoxin PrlF
MRTVVSEKGQVTIPKALRDRLGLRAGSVVEFTAVGGKLIGIKEQAVDPMQKWVGKGRLPADLDVDTYIDRIRG